MEARNLPSSGRILKISELFEESPSEWHDKSIRITGRLRSRNPAQCLAEVYDDKSQQSLVIDTTLIEPFVASDGCIVQFIGELEGGDNLKLAARIVRVLDQLDLTVYHKALECQRTYFSLRDSLVHSEEVHTGEPA